MSPGIQHGERILLAVGRGSPEAHQALVAHAVHDLQQVVGDGIGIAIMDLYQIEAIEPQTPETAE